MKLTKMMTLYLASEGLSLKDAARDIGISYSAIWRISQNKRIDTDSFLLLFTWLLKK